jgi:hypothetical protein
MMGIDKCLAVASMQLNHFNKYVFYELSCRWNISVRIINNIIDKVIDIFIYKVFSLRVINCENL